MSGLVKPKKINLADTNIALFGSATEKDLKLKSAQGEAAWNGIGKKEGLEIWRIENFKVVPWPKEQYGDFYQGDSYIVLRAYKAKPDDEKLSYDVHFWLGKDTTQDEAGTAAYKTVELDDFLGGAPVQHREVGGFESALFMSYFEKFNVLEGGVESGFKHVKPEEYRSRLMHIKGVRGHVVVHEVELSHKSLNSGDCFILDAGMTLYQFNGAGSNGVERNKAMELVNALARDRKSAKVVVLTEGDNEPAFWTAIGGQGKIKSAEEAGDDKETAIKNNVRRLFRLSDASGKVEFTKVAEGVIRKSMLDPKDVFVFDAGQEVYAWVGKECTPQEKRLAMQYAQNYLNEYKRPPQTPISRVLQGGENEVFLNSLDVEEGAARPVKAAGAAKDGHKWAPVAQANVKK